MRYAVDSAVFDLCPDLQFGILIGHDIRNTATTSEDESRLRQAENRMRETYHPDQVREMSNVSFYRELMTKAGINPNKFPPSVEAMFKRILKGGQLPVINALVDLCNAVSIERVISLGAHDLADIQADLEVRFSRSGDVFLPFGAAEYENVEPGELVFTGGNVVQTRKWIWRQSELGKTTLESRQIIFQLVGFAGDEKSSLQAAMSDIEVLVKERFQGVCERYLVDCRQPSIEF